jgi:hypothetical protein
VIKVIDWSTIDQAIINLVARDQVDQGNTEVLYKTRLLPIR